MRWMNLRTPTEIKNKYLETHAISHASERARTLPSERFRVTQIYEVEKRSTTAVDSAIKEFHVLFDRNSVGAVDVHFPFHSSLGDSVTIRVTRRAEQEKKYSC